MHKAALARLRQQLLALVPLLLMGCGETGISPKQAAAHPLYFDVKGLVESQMQQLAQRGAAVRKQVTLRGSAPETVRVPTVKWTDELQIFLQADINKAALRGAYAIDSVALPGGLLRRTYTRQPGQPNAPVAQLAVSSIGGLPQELSATITQQNPLFSAQKHLVMQLQQGQLRSYKVMGTQKLIFFDTLRYAAAGRVE